MGFFDQEFRRPVSGRMKAKFVPALLKAKSVFGGQTLGGVTLVHPQFGMVAGDGIEQKREAFIGFHCGQGPGPQDAPPTRQWRPNGPSHAGQQRWASDLRNHQNP